MISLYMWNLENKKKTTPYPSLQIQRIDWWLEGGQVRMGTFFFFLVKINKNNF